MSKALVIGGNGFIGSHLVDALAGQEWEVRVLDLYQRRYDLLPAQVRYIQGDLNQVYLLREALTGVEVVYHLAWATIHETSNQNLVEDVQANLIPSIHLLESCAWAGVSRVVFASSGGTVYGPAHRIPIHEDHPKNPINAYGVLKLTVEKYLHMFHRLHGLEYAILRPSAPYGPRQNPLGRQGAVAVFAYRIWRGLPLTLWGDGGATRDFFYISDLVEAMTASAIRSLPSDPVFNLGGGERISLLELVEQLEELIGRKARLEYLPGREFDAQHILLDTGRARQALDWEPKVPLEHGLELTWEWMRSTFE